MSKGFINISLSPLPTNIKTSRHRTVFLRQLVCIVAILLWLFVEIYPNVYFMSTFIVRFSYNFR